MARLIFGNENAEQDDLLYDCPVSHGALGKPILTGRWGAGKTALLMLANQKLAQVLRQQEPSDERLWYINEKKLDVKGLLVLRNEHARDERLLLRSLEEIWKAEITRTACVLLHRLQRYYGSPRGAHWEYIENRGRGGDLIQSVLHRIPEAITLIFGDATRGKAAKTIQGGLDEFLGTKALENVQKCLGDIRKGAPEFLPMPAIEPIDSPESPLEETPGLARSMITALLNVFESTFQPSSRQLLPVTLSIPWHRYDSKHVISPQKITQYHRPISWDEASLRDFIEKRIAWEFKRLGRPIEQLSPWYALFDRYVADEYTACGVKEDSFYYVLRHTHWRARDLQRLARCAVEKQADHSGVDVDHVLLGKKPAKVASAAICAGVRDACERMVDELLTEGSRRFEYLQMLFGRLRGLRLPLTRKELASQIPEPPGFGAAVSILWDSGVLGISMSTQDPSVLKDIRAAIGSECHRQYQISRGKVHVWSCFVYNCKRSYLELLDRFGKPTEGNARWILHPIVFRLLLPQVTTGWPLGA